LRIHTKNKPLSEDVNLEQLAELSEGYTGADISSMSSAAVMLALRKHITKYRDPDDAEKHAKELKVHMQEFEDAMKKIRPLSSQELTMYKRISEEFGKPEIGAKRRGSKDSDVTAGGIT
jgi:transitional endoplasmic reticulum ATPase